MSLLSGPDTPGYKPFTYPWAYEFWKRQNKIHWLSAEAQMAEDVKDWHSKLTDDDKQLVTQIFRFFVQADIEVADAYSEHYIPRFKHIEVQMMLRIYSATECNHIDSYAYLIDTVGLPEIEYSRFMDYKEMRDKNDFAYSQKSDTLHDLIKTMAIFSSFTEGLQLYASFCILLNFPRFNKMKGMGQIVSWVARDEALHCEGVLKLLLTLIEENQEVWTDKLKEEIVEACKVVIANEDAFIELAFKDLTIEGITVKDVKDYIRYVANRRLQQLGLEPIYLDNFENPVKWMDDQLNGVELVNFFEQKPTEYSKGALTGAWDDSAFAFED
jgi:ribonucleoside-diphosphate reductase beta chain